MIIKIKIIIKDNVFWNSASTRYLGHGEYGGWG